MNDLILALYVFFLSYWLILSFNYIFFLIAGFRESVRRLYEGRNTDFNILRKSDLTIPISIILPAFEEELTIVDAVYSALSSEYPEFEVIVVNDGSKDGMMKLLKDEFKLGKDEVFYPQKIKTNHVRNIFRSENYPNLWVIDKHNGGKADSLNAGVNFAHYRYIVDADADSIFDPQGLLRLSRVINADPGKIIGVGGQIRVINGMSIEKGRVVEKKFPERLIERFQLVEYLGSFLGNRTGWSEVNSVLVLSGAFALWRKDVVLELGGFNTETTHEDTEFTFRAHEYFRRNKIPYHIVFLPDPIVWSQVPSYWGDLFKQRRRWQRHVSEVSWQYKKMLFRPTYGTVGSIGLPYLLFFETFGPLVELVSYMAVILLFFFGLISLNLFLLYLVVSFGLISVIRISSVFVEQYSFQTYYFGSLSKLFLLAIIENFGYRQYVTVARLLGYIDFLRGKKTWERVKRHKFSEQKA